MRMNASFVHLLLALSLTGVTATLLYLLLRKDEDDLDELVEGVQTSRPGTIEVRIPKECVGVVIGRAGTNIKEIQDKSDTRINFKDEQEGDAWRVCVIRGTPESAQLAESLIHEFILNQPLIETSEIWVPQRACGRIIGRNGENIRGISRAACAKITVESLGCDKDPCAERRIFIKGTADQIFLAKGLILEKVYEDTDLRRKLEESLASRSPRKRERLQLLTAGDKDQVEKDIFPRERLRATGSDGFIEIYVSAVQHPSRFWLQVKGPQSVELDQLIDHMTEHYRLDENRELHSIRELTVGQVVAAPFSFDDKWYRAEVTSVSEDKYDPQLSQVSLFYVDYGDSGELQRKEVLELRTDFLRLRFQAIECSLAKVLPRNNTWTEEAIELFEELTQVAQWITLTARVDSYKERPRGESRPRREGSPVPCVELYGTRNSQDISVAEELVKQGFAVWEKSAASALKLNGEPLASSTPIALTGAQMSQAKVDSLKPLNYGKVGECNNPSGDGPSLDTSTLMQDEQIDENSKNQSSLECLSSVENRRGSSRHATLRRLLESTPSKTTHVELIKHPVYMPDTDDCSSDELEMC